jgi:hypothetical protein
MIWEHKNKSFAGLVLGFMVITGTYNSVVINSESELNGSNVKLVKRLDEVYGNVKSGRVVAASVSWKKVAPAPQQQKIAQVNPVPRQVQREQARPAVAAPAASEPAQAAIQTDLNLQLVEVVNPAKWKDGLKAEDFQGSLETNNGTIESLNVSLPGGGFSVAFAEMNGNVFEYDHDGDTFTGMIYQVGDKSYMVSLTNGPFEGSRLKFNIAEEADRGSYAHDDSAPAASNETEVYAGAQLQENDRPDLVTDGQMSDEEMQRHGQNFQQSEQTM